MVSTAWNRSLLGRAAVVHQQHAIDADAGRPQLGHRPGLALADLGNAVAAAQVEVDVAVAAQDAHRQRRRLAAVQVDPVKRDLLQLLVGRVLVRRAHDQFLGLEVRGRLAGRRAAGCWSARSAA